MVKSGGAEVEHGTREKEEKGGKGKQNSPFVPKSRRGRGENKNSVERLKKNRPRGRSLKRGKEGSRKSSR